MKVRLLLLGLLACALLACGDRKNLSVGEVRCEGVSCTPFVFEAIDAKDVELEQIDREDELVPVVGSETFCGELSSLSDIDQEPSSEPRCLGEKLIPVGDEQFIIATKYTAYLDSERIESGLRLAHYAGGELQWESRELSREVASSPRNGGDSFEIAGRDVPGEAIVGMTRETGDRHAYGQAFYAIEQGGELVELFEDDTAGRIRALVALGDDIIVASDYEARIEITRYTAKGTIVWRQTTVTAFETFTEGPINFQDTAVRLIDDERLILLVPRVSGFEAIELTTGGELVRSWMNYTFADALVNGRLATGPNGELFVGIDGYNIERCTLAGDEPRRDSFRKQRTQYYEPAVLGLHVDNAGYIYVATIEGDLARPFGLIERVSPDLRRRESFVIADDLAPEGFSLLVGGELFVSDDQRTLYFAASGTLGSMALPPIED